MAGSLLVMQNNTRLLRGAVERRQNRPTYRLRNIVVRTDGGIRHPSTVQGKEDRDQSNPFKNYAVVPDHYS